MDTHAERGTRNGMNYQFVLGSSKHRWALPTHYVYILILLFSTCSITVNPLLPSPPYLKISDGSKRNGEEVEEDQDKIQQLPKIHQIRRHPPSEHARVVPEMGAMGANTTRKRIYEIR